jgi:hypothetical protein
MQRHAFNNAGRHSRQWNRGNADVRAGQPRPLSHTSMMISQHAVVTAAQGDSGCSRTFSFMSTTQARVASHQPVARPEAWHIPLVYLPLAADLWVQASLDYKQRLQQLFFPEGIAYDAIRFNRTAVTAPLFNYLATWRGLKVPMKSRAVRSTSRCALRWTSFAWPAIRSSRTRWQA